MGTNTLTSFTSGPITVDTVNQYFTALGGNFVPRQVSGSSAAPIDNTYFLGTASYRWKEAHITDLYLNGSLFDPDAVGVDSKFAINSGQTVSGSDKSDFIRASGSGASATILATTTNLQITANSVSVTVTSDISVSSLTVAPSTNNTCLVNDAALAGGNETKYTGENENDPITIDNVGTEITDRIGQYVCLKHNTTGEYIFAYVEDATTLNRCYRGFFFDSSGNPVTRDVLSNNDQLNLMSLGWVFLDNDGTTVDVTYTSPIYSATEPASPVTDDYWFDLTNRLWKRYSGSAFVQVDRVLIGLVVIDTTNCVASRSFDFTKAYDPFISLEVELDSTTVVKTSHGYSAVHVNGQIQELYAGAFQWDITSDLESGLTEASSTHYYLYVTEDGAPIISEERPYNREHDLRGYYHPYNSWRYVGMAFNDGSSDLQSVKNLENNNNDLVLIRTIEANSITSVDFDFEDINSKSNEYVLKFHDVVPDTVNTDLWFRIGVDSTILTDANYRYSANESADSTSDTGNTFFTTASTGDSKIIITPQNVGRGDLANDSDSSVEGEIKISNVNNPNRYKMIRYETAVENAIVGQGLNGRGHHSTNTGKVNKIQILASSGNISGVFSLYRYKK